MEIIALGDGQLDFGFSRLLSPELQRIQLERIPNLRTLLRARRRRYHELHNRCKALEKRNFELEEKYIGLTQTYNELVRAG